MQRQIVYILILFFLNCAGCTQSTTTSDLALQSAFLNLKQQHQVLASSHSSHYLSQIAERLSDAVPARTKRLLPEVYIVRSQEPIAVAGPDGEILLSTRFLNSIDTEAQLIFVLSHELAHSVLEHSKQPVADTVARQARFRHQAELEADSFAVSVMVVAGYDPRHATQALAFVYRLQGIEPDINTHPDFADRVYAIHSAITESNWLPPGIESSRSFNEFKNDFLR